MIDYNKLEHKLESHDSIHYGDGAPENYHVSWWMDGKCINTGRGFETLAYAHDYVNNFRSGFSTAANVSCWMDGRLKCG